MFDKLSDWFGILGVSAFVSGVLSLLIGGTIVALALSGIIPEFAYPAMWWKAWLLLSVVILAYAFAVAIACEQLGRMYDQRLKRWWYAGKQRIRIRDRNNRLMSMTVWVKEITGEFVVDGGTFIADGADFNHEGTTNHPIYNEWRTA